MTQIDVQVLVKLDLELGEGPYWDARTETLSWVDIPSGRLFRRNSGTVAVDEIGQPLGAAVPSHDAGYVLATRDGIHYWDNGVVTLLTALDEDRPGNQCNDAKCDPGGRLWAGTLDSDEREGLGRLYCIWDPGAHEVRLDGLTTSNGLGWSPDGSLMFHIDSPRRRVDSYPFDETSGAIGPRSTFADLSDRAGLPDGLAVDVQGGVWVAMYGGGCVVALSPDGVPVEQINLSVSKPTSCAFFGQDLDLLAITSAREGLSREDLDREPDAGAVFVATMPVRGQQVSLFRGAARRRWRSLT